MRKFLLACCFSVWALAASAGELPALAALDAFKPPMDQIVREAGKGKEADFDAIVKAYADADKAWKLLAGETLDLDRYGVPAAKQEEAWRRVRMMGMLVRYIDEGVGRGDMALIRRSAALLPQAYADLRAALENR